MFSELDSILNISPENFPQTEFTLVSDRKADASFLIHYFLSFYLRAGCKVCFLGLVQSFSHYSAVSQRLGVSLIQAREKGQLVFLEGLKGALAVLLEEKPNPSAQTLGFLRSPHTGLRGLYEFVQESLMTKGEEGKWGPPVLIVDDLTVFLSLGVRVGAVLDFTHYCRAFVCSKLQGNVVMLIRGEEEEGDEEGSELLLKGLTHQCSLALRVEGLPTGYCRDIHGQMEVFRRVSGSCVGGLKTHKNLFQFKVHDKGASFFARGTSSAVL
ncbi:elongator complex protein 6 [Anguilla rostrata]|uniref:Elongator complex protein 6 n=1 Tax=Anguilla anguilla TaxID=7936 RepID=A0A9D3MZX4_ANGAN|nr:elongator complex protein 6 [Anguilla anguilla]XP_035253631.1 elongator complex protein 6 [Anguilla anguilla]XP_035253719.1 elongator complex protein 6 [Anguilla anguilla]KAG5856821.1 hypothetical protein ANANG_G00011960 [Anguilla anguilla]